jgi:hypothetical protein
MRGYSWSDALSDIKAEGGWPVFLLSLAVLLMLFGAILGWTVILWALQAAAS